jgi:Uma2 family endonuclease
MNAVVEELLASPTLPDTLARLNAALREERQRRERFYEEITPEMKAEFINGQVIMHSPAAHEHSLIRQYIEKLLSTYVDQHALGVVSAEKSLCVFPRNDYEPDVILFGPEKAKKLRAKTLKFPIPDFVCEILSDSTAKRDRGVKFEDYQAHGVREYWIVNPDRREVEQYVLEKGRYTLRMKSRTGEVASVAIKGFRAPLAAFFDPKANLAELRRMLAA